MIPFLFGYYFVFFLFFFFWWNSLFLFYFFIPSILFCFVAPVMSSSPFSALPPGPSVPQQQQQQPQKEQPRIQSTPIPSSFPELQHKSYAEYIFFFINCLFISLVVVFIVIFSIYVVIV
jgi:hypothetical protein